MNTQTAQTQTSLNLDDTTALLRGIERADEALIEQFISIIREMREPGRYSNQDVDRRMHARGYLNDLRKVGNTPLQSFRAA